MIRDSQMPAPEHSLVKKPFMQNKIKLFYSHKNSLKQKKIQFTLQIANFQFVYNQITTYIEME